MAYVNGRKRKSDTAKQPTVADLKKQARTIRVKADMTGKKPVFINSKLTVYVDANATPEEIEATKIKFLK